MANFPLSVYSPSAVSNGQTIDASRDNAQDAEITALESGYLTGTAPLNSSNSTLAHLSVTGGSTLAGTLSVAGGSTLATLTVTGGSTLASLTVVASAPSARVTSSAAPQIPNSAATAISFDIERWQTVTGMHSTGSNPTRLIPAASSGLYLLGGSVTWAGGSTGSGVCLLQVRIDGSSLVASVQDKDPSGLIQTVSAPYYFRSTGQYAELIVTQNSGSTKSISLTSDYSPDFWITRLQG